MSERSKHPICDDLLAPGPPKRERLIERLAHCLSGDLKRQALRRCGNADDASDAVQEALTVALRYIDGFRGDASLRSWMLRLVNSACTRQRRGRRNNPALHEAFEQVDGQELPSEQPAPEQQLLIEEKLSRMASALASLPDEERNLLLQHEGEGARIVDLAERTGQTAAAVRTRIYRARQRLRATLEDLLGPPTA
jgi:RNA polymerase sigma-70 factor (ECF subfamily)